MEELYKMEIEESKKYVLKVEKNGLIELSRFNVALVENMIRTDNRYRKSFDKDAKPEGKYNGSSAYWFTRLNENLEKNLQYVINALDIENSTHLNSDSVGRKELTNRLIERYKNVDELKADLQKTDKYIELIDELATKTNPSVEKYWMESRNPNKKYNARRNLSFASKFCHYASYYLLGDEYKDEFSIYDEVIKRKLPEYLKYYKVPFERRAFDDYIKYNQLIGELLNKLDERISRRGFDQLIWYYYK